MRTQLTIFKVCALEGWGLVFARRREGFRHTFILPITQSATMSSPHTAEELALAEVCVDLPLVPLQACQGAFTSSSDTTWSYRQFFNPICSRSLA